MRDCLGKPSSAPLPYEPNLTLREAAKICRRLFPSGLITERSLRTERERGRLRTFKLAGKVFTTEPDLRTMIEAARCRDQGKALGSTSDPALTGRQRGLSETERTKSALVAARESLNALNRRSSTTSQVSIRPRKRSAISSKTSSIDWWGSKTLADVKGKTCRDYVAWRIKLKVSDQTARHDLKTLRAAINHYHREHGPLPSVPKLTLPARSPPRERWLTRGEVAGMIRAARRGRLTRHVARLVLIGIYSGTRSKSMLRLKWLPSTDGGWVDLDAGILHRRGLQEKQTKKRRTPARIPERLLPHLKRWHAQDMAMGIVHVIHYYGRPIVKLRRSWDTARDAAELGEDVVPHTLRHTAAHDLDQPPQAAAHVAEGEAEAGDDDDDDGDHLGDGAFDRLEDALQRRFPRHAGAGGVRRVGDDRTGSTGNQRHGGGAKQDRDDTNAAHAVCSDQTV
jgi:hypothetical protein